MTWANFIASQFEEDYFQELDKFLRKEAKEHTIYPKQEDIFKAFEATPIDKVKVVILGQDPYIGKNQAMGLSFSVPDGERVPPSLRNIFAEIKDDLDLVDYEFKNGNLTHWTKQGVFLLNSCLTVRDGESGSHSKIGWQLFTDAAIQVLNSQDRPIVFALWGNYAKTKAKLLDNPKHLVLRAAHPSPFSAHDGFFWLQTLLSRK
jgi:uracil-DNA glycosylase